MKESLLAQAEALPIDEQVELVAAIWGGLVERDEVPPPTAEQQKELNRRLQRHLVNPGKLLSLEEVSAAVNSNTRRNPRQFGP